MPAPYVPKTRRWALVVVVIVSLGLAATVAAPLWIPIVLGCVMAISAYRPYRALSRRLGESWAAGGLTLAAGLAVGTIGTAVLIALASELMKIVTHLDAESAGSLEGIIGHRANDLLVHAGVDTARVYAWASNEVQELARAAAGAAAVIVRTTTEALLGLVVALMTMYYVLREGSSLARRIEAVAPLEPRHTRELLVEAREVGRTAFIGTLMTALVQGAVAGVAYTSLGVPQPVTWAALTAFASFLPVIGTVTVWLPVAGWLLFDGHPVKAVLMLLWGALVVIAVCDYVIRPRIVGGRGHGHPLLTLIALLGGIEVFGLAGLIIAPIVMSVSVAAFRLYERELKTGGVPGTTTSPGV